MKDYLPCKDELGKNSILWSYLTIYNNYCYTTNDSSCSMIFTCKLKYTPKTIAYLIRVQVYVAVKFPVIMLCKEILKISLNWIELKISWALNRHCTKDTSRFGYCSFFTLNVKFKIWKDCSYALCLYCIFFSNTIVIHTLCIYFNFVFMLLLWFCSFIYINLSNICFIL